MKERKLEQKKTVIPLPSSLSFIDSHSYCSLSLWTVTATSPHTSIARAPSSPVETGTQYISSSSYSPFSLLHFFFILSLSSLSLSLSFSLPPYSLSLALSITTHWMRCWASLPSRHCHLIAQQAPVTFRHRGREREEERERGRERERKREREEERESFHLGGSEEM